jgi:UDP-N-acetylmuramate dehydrogenase
MKQNISLKKHHSFGISVNAAKFAVFRNEKGLQSFLPVEEPFMLLGGGSNVLFTKDFKGLVAQNKIKGIEIVSEDDSEVLIRVGGGEVWHDLVLWCIEKGFAGIENLSLIPGSVGAAPIQNIGAYGVELKDVFYSLEAICLKTGDTVKFSHEECQFGYRDSVFKRELRGKYCITRVLLKLNKIPVFNTSYGIIKDILEESKEEISIRSLSNAVIKIRRKKLPDPAEIGNSGSFFKNPVISLTQFSNLKIQFPDMPFYPVGEKVVKLAAGWLIDDLGWKGYRKGDAGVHVNQALVLVNYGNAKGTEIWNLAKAIQTSVLDKFGVALETEVNVL